MGFSLTLIPSAELLICFLIAGGPRSKKKKCMEGTNDPQNTVFLLNERTPKTFQHKQMTVKIASRAEKGVLSYSNFTVSHFNNDFLSGGKSGPAALISTTLQFFQSLE